MSLLARSLNVLAGPAIERLTPSRFISIARELNAAMETDWNARRAQQLERLNALIVHACATVPLYRDRFDAEIARRGLSSLDELCRLPLLSKRDLTAGFPDQVTAEHSDRGDWQYVASSGTVDRVVTVTEFARRDVGRGAALHAWQRGCDYRPGKPVVQIAANICNVVCGADASNADESFRREFRTWFGKVLRRKPASLSDLRGAYERRVFYRTRMLDPLSLGATDVDPARLEEYWQRLHRESPYIVHALPEYLLLLAEYARRQGKGPLGPRYFLPMGGLASPAMRQRITEGLGGTFLDFYGTAELGVVAFESADEAGAGMHVVQEQFIVEVVGANRFGPRDRLLAFDPVEHPVALQLGGDDPATMAEAARIGEDYGYDEININVGCPSSRVQSGNFGACLMRTPRVVAACVEAMRAKVAVPVTVKCRIGVDDHDHYDDMRTFADAVVEAGADRIIVHARKAWLQGLSPKQNRTIPPLRYEEVHRLRRELEHVPVEINGGFVDLDSAEAQLEHVDGVMIGRGVWHNPWMLHRADERFFGHAPAHADREQVVLALDEYLRAQVAAGVPAQHVLRHVGPLFAGERGAKAWRQAMARAHHLDHPETAIAQALQRRDAARARRPLPRMDAS